MTRFEQILQTASQLSNYEKAALAKALRAQLPLHPVEERLMISADGILESFSRAGDFTIRMIRGIFAEGAFAADVLPTLIPRWREIEVVGDPPYDFLLTDSASERPGDGEVVRVQVKMQRSVAGKPLRANKQWSTLVDWPSDHFVVELQKSRKGEKAGKSTRPYRFGEFDIVAVSLGPSSGRWADFTYAVADWLLPDPDKPDQILTFQPVSPTENDSWTRDFETAVKWLRGAKKGRIRGSVPKAGSR